MENCKKIWHLHINAKSNCGFDGLASWCTVLQKKFRRCISRNRRVSSLSFSQSKENCERCKLFHLSNKCYKGLNNMMFRAPKLNRRNEVLRTQHLPTQAARQWLEEKINQPNVFTQCQQDRECVLVCMLVVFIFKCSSGNWVTLVFANSRSRSTLMFKLTLCGVVYLDCCFGLGCAQWIFLSVECPVGIFYFKCILSKESDGWIHEETW